jgi:inorganic pyrophosphatase
MPDQAVNPSNYENIRAFPEETDPEKDFLVNMVVETPAGIRHKYAFDPQSGMFQLRTTIPEGLTWPYDYGFVPRTLGDDGDPLDILFLDDEPTFVGCLVQARLLGIVRLTKNGKENDRLVACAKRLHGVAQNTDPFEKIDDLPKPRIDSLCRFLVNYSEEQGNEIEFKGVDGRKKALQAVRDGIEKFDAKKTK